MSFVEFFSQAFQNPLLLVSTILTLGVILVNGWTDAPNAIATCVSTKAIGIRKAIVMAAVFNLLGVFIMTAINASVAMTIYNMVDFGEDAKSSIIALCAAMAAIVIWATVAWKFGIPTSESHALIAGLTGAAVAINDSFSGVNGAEWLKVIVGLLLSTLLGFGLGYLFAKLTVFLFKDKNRKKYSKYFQGAQIVSGASMAFMHGAQDGQKFMAIFLLGATFASGQTVATSFVVPIWLIILCSVVMGLGTSIGGYRIIKSVGTDMVKLKPYQGFAADLSATLCLFLSSLIGIPVSTTHTKTTAMMGVGAAKRLSNVKWSVVKDLVFTWIFTFPGCGLLGFGMAKLFLSIFS